MYERVLAPPVGLSLLEISALVTYIVHNFPPTQMKIQPTQMIFSPTHIIYLPTHITGWPVNFVTPVKFVTCYKSVQGLALSIL